jgi:predicted dehydrogenase
MISPRPTRWGILATGRIANDFVEDLQLLADAEVTAVGSRSVEAAEVFARRHSIPRAYGSWAELAADPDVDVVYVATPHSAHYAATMVCLDAGKAVLCEKPFTLDRASSEDLVRVAAKRGLFLMEAMWTLTNPTIQRIQRLVNDGTIGEVMHVGADFGVAGPFPVGHRMRAPELGGGALLDLGVYPVTIAHAFLGAPSTVQAWASLLPEGTDENTAMVLGYDSGAVATLQAGMVGDTAQRAVITGRAGRIEIDRLFYRPDTFTLTTNEGRCERVEVEVRGNGMGYEAEEVMRCLRAGLTESPVIPLRSTLAVMSILDRVREQIGVTYPPAVTSSVLPQPGP